MRFRLWAPRPSRVELVLRGSERIEMRAVGDRGWLEADADAEPGTDYGFSVDGGEVVPDPRSPWQPEGVEGPSRTVDHARFDWTDSGWRGIHLPSEILYELHVGTFSPAGSFDGVIEKLDHLVDLGVGVVELMPVNQFPGRRGWGYDGVDLYAVHDPYGGPEGLKRLVDACHARGLGVVLDVVYNHLGPSGNHLHLFGPYFTDRYETPWGDAVNLDGAGSDEVRAFFCENAEMWLRDYHIDGLRIDAVHAFIDRSATHLLEELAERVEVLSATVGRPLWLVAESDLNDPRIVRRREVGGYGVDAQWSDDLHHALHVVLTGEQAGYYVDFDGLESLADALRRVFVNDGRWSTYRQRRHGRPATDLSAHRFLGYVQNHDQVGNRARGERIAHLSSIGLSKVGAALVLTAPFVPLLFAGEEWAASTPFLYFTDHRDPDLAEAVSRGRRNEFSAFGWEPEAVPDPQDPATFDASRLRWEERSDSPHREMLDWYRALIALRRASPDLADGRLDRMDVRRDDSARTLRVERSSIVVAANFDDRPQRVEVGAGRSLLLGSEPGIRLAGGEVELPPESCAVLGRG
ncbi:MAG: malto-oligosyltrehalose trehalohydrolase [bacterium]